MSKKIDFFFAWSEGAVQRQLAKSLFEDEDVNHLYIVASENDEEEPFKIYLKLLHSESC